MALSRTGTNTVCIELPSCSGGHSSCLLLSLLHFPRFISTDISSTVFCRARRVVNRFLEENDTSYHVVLTVYGCMPLFKKSSGTHCTDIIAIEKEMQKNNEWLSINNSTVIICFQSSCRGFCSWVMVVNSGPKRGFFCTEYRCPSKSELWLFGHKISPLGQFIQLEIHPPSIPLNHFKGHSGGEGQSQQTFGERRGFTLDRSPAHHGANIL